MRRRMNLTPWILALPVVLTMVFLVVSPSLHLVFESFRGPDGSTGLTLANYREYFLSSVSEQATSRTIRVSLATTLASILIAYPVSYFMAKTRSRLRPLLLAIIVFPLLTSAVVRGYGWTVVLGRNGILNSALLATGVIQQPLKLIGTEAGIVIGVTHFVLPFMVLSLMSVMQKIPPSLEEAAYSLGANPIRTFVRIVLPLSLPGLISGILLVVSLSITIFAIPLLLGGGRMLMLTTLLYQLAFYAFDWAKAGTVAVILMAVGVTIIVINRRLSAVGMRRIE